MNYLLDTNAAIALMKGDPAGVRSRFGKALASKSSVFISVIALHELWYGVGLSDRNAESAAKLRMLLTSSIAIAPFDEEDAEIAGGLRASLKLKGKPIGAYDVLIAAQALRMKATVVTANLKEFTRIDGLKCQNWGA